MAETWTWSEWPFGDSLLAPCLELLGRSDRARSRARSATPSEVSSEAAANPRFTDPEQVLGEPVEGLRALVLVGLDGHVHDRLILDERIGEVVGEFATLLKIACRTGQDAGSGPLLETTWTFGEDVVVLTRHVSDERFLVLVGGVTLRTSLARYVLRQAARQLASE